MHAEDSDVIYTSGAVSPDSQNAQRISLDGQCSADNIAERDILRAREVLVDYQRHERALYYPIGQPLTQVRHWEGQKRVKSFEISLGYGRVCTTFLNLERL